MKLFYITNKDICKTYILQMKFVSLAKKKGCAYMQRMSEFGKVSYDQFKKDWLDTWFEDEKDYINSITGELDGAIEYHIKQVYDSIELPKRATMQSAGYDFYIPISMTIEAGESKKIPTGINCGMYDGWVLMLYPRSGHGFKYGIHMANTVGIIDGDYIESDNEGHIFVKLVNDSSIAKDIRFDAGDAFCQGVFLPFGITLDDNVSEQRNGGFGYTGR